MGRWTRRNRSDLTSTSQHLSFSPPLRGGVKKWLIWASSLMLVDEVDHGLFGKWLVVRPHISINQWECNYGNISERFFRNSRPISGDSWKWWMRSLSDRLVGNSVRISRIIYGPHRCDGILEYFMDSLRILVNWLLKTQKKIKFTFQCVMGWECWK